MRIKEILMSATRFARVLVAAVLLGAVPPQEVPLRVCATCPDLGALVREVGGDAVFVTVFTKGSEDPHYVEARPSFVRSLSEADLLAYVGMELEDGYLPVLIRNSRNARIQQPSADGHLDASTAIQPLQVPEGPVTRAMGDVHLRGNPHYLLDPVRGLKVAELIAARLSKLRPALAPRFEERLASFRARLGKALLGEALFARYPSEFEKLAFLHENGKLRDFVAKLSPPVEIGGWIGRLLSHDGAKLVADHNLWPYFASRYHLEVAGFLEPKPGLMPTTKHLSDLAGRMKTEGIRVILASAYYDPCHAQSIAKATAARIALMAHQAEAREGTRDYLDWMDYNVRTLAEALR
jgi:ABC-type Zn uptake system ZnuABC Zn-binding protein ZnuA